MHELLHRRDRHRREWELDDGRRRLQLSPVPVNVWDHEKKRWDAVDLDLRMVGPYLEVGRASYRVRIPTWAIGFEYKSREQRGDLVLKLDRVLSGGQEVDVNVDRYTVSGNQVTFHDVAPDTDIRIECRANAVKVFKVLRSASAPEEFVWVAKASNEHPDIAVPTMGRSGRPGEAAIQEVDAVEEDIGHGRKKVTITARWTGVVGVRDPETRVPSRSTDVAYPVELDPTINETIAANADDGFEYFGTWDEVGYPGYWFYEYLGYYFGTYYRPGWRFTGIGIDQGATIDSATLTVNVLNANGASGTVYGSDIDDMAAWSDSNRPSQQAKTTASAAIDATSTGSKQIDVQAVVQEIVDRAGWANGNDIGLFAEPDATYGTRSSISDYYNGSNIATLDVTYTSGPDLDPPSLTSATINAAGDQITLSFDDTVTRGANHLDSHFTLESAEIGGNAMSYVSGDGTRDLVFSLARTAWDHETYTLDYAQPGDGIEDDGGNDLASFTDTAVTNDSELVQPPQNSDYAYNDIPDPDANTSDVVFVVDLADMPAAFWSSATSSDWRRMRVSGASGGAWPMHVVNYSHGSGGILYARRGGSLTVGSTGEIRIYPPQSDEPAIPDNHARIGRNQTWQDYIAVYHGDVSGSPLIDSTGNYDLTADGGATANAHPELSLGLAFSAGGYIGTNPSELVPSGFGGQPDTQVSYWVKDASIDDDEYIVSLGERSGDPAPQWGLKQKAPDVTEVRVSCGTGFGNYGTCCDGTEGVWEKRNITFPHETDPDNGADYLNRSGSQSINLDSCSQAPTDGGGFGIGLYYKAATNQKGGRFTGSLAEIRISNRTRDDARTFLEYDNEDDITTYWGAWSFESSADVTANIADSAPAATESLSASTDRQNADVADSAPAATDSLSASTDRQNADIADAAPAATESLSASTDRQNADVTETAPAATDSASATAVRSADIADEAAAATGTASATAGRPADIADAAPAAAESLAASTDRQNADVAETAPAATDSIDTTGGRDADIAETAPAATDAASATAIRSADIADAAPAATESIVAGKVTSADIAETAPAATDAVAATAIRSADVTETAPAATDSLAATAVRNADVLEAAPAATGIMSATAGRGATLAESAAAATGTATVDLDEFYGVTLLAEYDTQISLLAEYDTRIELEAEA